VYLAPALFLLLVVLCLGGLIMWIRLAASNKRVIEVPESELEDFFRGGVMCRYVITSGTLARLDFFDWGVRLRGIAISRWIVPTWEARYDELASAELVTLPASRIAVWLRIRDKPEAIAFLSEQSMNILTALAKQGVQVNKAVTRIRRVEELYR
jgi:hypothetical protein